MAVSKKSEQINSLGQAQANLEYTTKELRSAQRAFELARNRLALAEEGHQLAITLLVSEVSTVRENSKVIPNILR